MNLKLDEIKVVGLSGPANVEKACWKHLMGIVSQKNGTGTHKKRW